MAAVRARSVRVRGEMASTAVVGNAVWAGAAMAADGAVTTGAVRVRLAAKSDGEPPREVRWATSALVSWCCLR